MKWWHIALFQLSEHPHILGTPPTASGVFPGRGMRDPAGMAAPPALRGSQGMWGLPESCHRDVPPSRATAAPVPCSCGVVWQHVPVARRLRALAHYSTAHLDSFNLLRSFSCHGLSWCTTELRRSYLMVMNLSPRGEGPTTTPSTMFPVDRLYFRGYPGERRDI